MRYFKIFIVGISLSFLFGFHQGSLITTEGPYEGTSDYCNLFGAVYIEENPNRADFKVYEEETEAFANIIVFEEQNRLYADRKGIWYFTKDREQADFTIHFTNSKKGAQFFVYFTDTESFAGCND